MKVNASINNLFTVPTSYSHTAYVNNDKCLKKKKNPDMSKKTAATLYISKIMLACVLMSAMHVIPTA